MSQENTSRESYCSEGLAQAQILNGAAEMKHMSDDDQYSTSAKRFKSGEEALLDSDLKLDDINPDNFLEEIIYPFLENTDNRTMYEWLLKHEVLKKPNKCGSESSCSGDLEIVYLSDLTVDPVWKCMECHHRILICKDSVFSSFPCSIQLSLRIMMAWAKGYSSKDCFKDIGTYKEHYGYADLNAFIYRIRLQCMEFMDSYMWLEGYKNLKLGGPGCVVIVNLSSSLKGIKTKLKKVGQHRKVDVLWMADTRHIPVRFYSYVIPMPKRQWKIRQEVEKVVCAEEDIANSERNQNCIEGNSQKPTRVLREHQETSNEITMQFDQTEGIIKQLDNRYKNDSEEDADENKPKHPVKISRNENRKNKTEIQKSGLVIRREEIEQALRDKEMLDAILAVFHDHVAPKSLIVANEDAIPNICSALRSSGRYEAVVSLQEITSIDDGLKPASSILSNIWEPVCTLHAKVIKNSTHIAASKILTEFQWRRLFGGNLSSAMYYLLTQIGSYFTPKPKSNAKPKVPQGSSSSSEESDVD